MKVLDYLFCFGGRINRAKMWLFLLVTFVWTIVTEVIAIFGLHWSHYLQALQVFSKAAERGSQPPFPVPDPVTGTGWVVVAVIALLIVAYIVAYFAVLVKRLHDRNKGAVWLLPYVALPWALDIFVLATGSCRGFPTGLFHGPLGIARGVAYAVVMLIGLWVFIELYFFRGTAGDNRFGANPLAPSYCDPDKPLKGCIPKPQEPQA